MKFIITPFIYPNQEIFRLSYDSNSFITALTYSVSGSYSFIYQMGIIMK
jgi:hypothetical protein